MIILYIEKEIKLALDIVKNPIENRHHLDRDLVST